MWGGRTPPCVRAWAFLSPSPVMLLTPVFGEAATTSWPRWRRMGTVFEPIRPVPPITMIFIPNLLVRSPQAGVCDGCAASRPKSGAIAVHDDGALARAVDRDVRERGDVGASWAHPYLLVRPGCR